MKKFIVLLLVMLTFQLVNAQEKTKSGWSFGAVPVVAYDSDIGFKYGGLVNFYDYGDGSIYPSFQNSIYLEWSRTTKGSGINQILYDSGELFDKIRINGEFSFLTEQALDFYGFNGYEALYDPKFEDDEDTVNYISRMFYRHERQLIRTKAEFMGDLSGAKLRWLGGVAFYGNKIKSVDIDKLNEGQDSTEMLPTVNLLYDNYVNWGIIPNNQKDGGGTMLVKAGLVYDTRDNEPNPQSGIWEELILVNGTTFLGDENLNFTKLILTHRQYFTLIKNKLSFAYRLSYQGKIAGEMPFFMLPFVYDSKQPQNGIGGAKTLRGVQRNRIAGESMTFGTAEVRWIFLRSVVAKQNIYLALSGFTDWGMVIGKYDYDTSGVPVGTVIVAEDEGLHLGFGGGFRFALNENFIIAVDQGFVADPRDGDSGLYIGLNWLF